MSSTDVRQDWRFWPVVCLALLYPINNSLIMLAIPLYFFRQGTDLIIIGFLVAGITLTYSFSPLIFRNIGDKIGRKSSIIISLLGTLIAQLIFYFTLDPLFFFISRVTEGFVTGLFWTNLQSSISDNALLDHKKKLSRYNFGWNTGVLLGFLTGALVLFFMNDDIKMIFYVAPIFIFISLLISIFFFKESKKVSIESANHLNREVALNSTNKNWEIEKLYIPVILPILFVVAFSFAKGTINLLYPIKSEILGFAPYTVFLLSFLALIAQLITTTGSSYLSMNSLKKFSIISILVLIIIFIIFGVNSEFIIFAILYLILGFFGGILISFGLKLSVMLNIKKHTSRYSSTIESSIGITYLIAPIFVAFIADFQLTLAFFVVALVFIFFLVIGLIFLKKLEINFD